MKWKVQWHKKGLAKEKIRKERGELLNEVGDAEREHSAVHEENFWSSWPREDERGEDERTARADKYEEEKSEKEEKRGGERRERNGDEEDVRVSFRWRPLKFLVKGDIWRVVVIFLGKTPWRKLGIGLIVNLFHVRVCGWCLM